MHGRETVELFLLGREEGMSVREAAELAGGGDPRGRRALGPRGAAAWLRGRPVAA